MQVNKQNVYLSFLAGFFTSGFILCAVYFAFFFLTFNLGGGETIRQIEDQNSIFLIMTVLQAIVIALAIRGLLTKRQAHKACGVGAMSLIIFICAMVYYIDNFIPHNSFETVLWMKSQQKPLGMAATLVEKEKLVGLTRQEIEKLLGKGDEHSGDSNTERGSISYFIENNWTMTVYFEKDRVVSSELRLPWLSV